MNRVLGALLMAVPTFVVVYYTFGAFLGAEASHQLWPVVHWFHAAAGVVALIYARQWASDLDDDASTKDFLTYKGLYLGAVIWALWFFPNWVLEYHSGAEGTMLALHEKFWFFIEPLFFIVSMSAGCRLWHKK